MKRSLVLALALAVGTAGAACTDSTGLGASVAGTYTLQTINGFQLPVVVDNSGNPTTEVVLSQITLNADGSFNDFTRYRDTYPGQQPILVDEVDTGFWSVSGNRISLDYSNFPGDPSIGTISGDLLLFDDFGLSLVYRR